MKFRDDVDFWKGTSKVAKGAKFLGVLGNGIMVGDFANKGADVVVDAVADTVTVVGKRLGKIFW